MLRDGISEDCLGTYKKRTTPAPIPANPADALRASMRRVLADGSIRALADLKIRMLEVIDGETAPKDWDGFVAFAERAGVSRSKRYEAAERWGRSATEVGTPSGETVSSGSRSQAKSAVPKRDANRQLSSRSGTVSAADRPEAGQQTLNDNLPPAA
jgi:hypothetical protein